MEPPKFYTEDKIPYQVDEKKLDDVFKDKEKGFKNNKGPTYHRWHNGKNNEFTGNFIIDKNINKY